MLFTSSVFVLVFLPITLFVYFIIPSKAISQKNFVLLIASLVFYSWGEPKYILVMLISIFTNYFCAVLIDSYKKKDSSGNKSKFILVIDISFNIGVLGYFKYTDFIIQTINNLTEAGIGIFSIALPIGISFYTFQTMSYVIDVYQGKVNVQKNILILATYITLFPQLIAGPIVRYSDVEYELTARTSSAGMISEGIRRFIIGFSKKLLIANQMGVIWDEIYGALANGNAISAVEAWLGAIAFTFQIYFDFSGYSDMAIGLGKVLGFNFLENFNYPYISKSITEFWRRWHMSLSSWFKEYVYIPLGGNRKGLARQIINISIVWALTGLWHGAGWNFVLWGGYYGVLLIIEKLFLLKLLERVPPKLNWIRIIYCMFFVIVGWVIFNVTDYTTGIRYIKYMFGTQKGIGELQYYLRTRMILFALAIIAATPFMNNFLLEMLNKIKNHTVRDAIETATYLLLLVISIAFLVSGSYNPFLYFRF